MDLARALHLGDQELVSFVGAGGKKTSMARLAEQGQGSYRVGYTTTTHMPPPEAFPVVVDAPAEIPDRIEAAPTARDPIAFASERIENPARVDAKVKGFDPGTIDSIYESGRLDWLLVKADGARMREFKAPGAGEPVVPSRTTLLVPVVSAKIFGTTLSEEAVHRPERVADIAGIQLGAEVTPEIVGAVLADDRGGLKDAPSTARVIPMINKADGPESQESAQEALKSAFSRTDRFEAGLVTSFKTDGIERVSPSE